jgi:branched-chain amino acid transport system substrate-binding protein
MATVGGAFARGARASGRVLTALTLTAGLTVAVGSLGQAAASAASKSPLLVGDLCSCTGPEASTIGQTTSVVEAWAKSVNASGGIDGHQVQVVVKDDAYNPATSSADAQALVEQDHVVAIIDNSDEDNAWEKYIQTAKVPVIGGTESVAGYTSPDFFPPGGTFNYDVGAGAVSAKKVGVKKLAVLYCVEVAICAQASAEDKTLLPKVGLKEVFSAGIGFAAPNYSAQCLAAQQSGADAMTVGDASAIVTKVAENCATQGYKPRELSADGSVAIAWLSVPAMNGNVDVQADLPWFVHNAATKPMYAALAKYAPGVTTGPNFGEVVLQSWVAGVELQLAAEAGKIGAKPTAAEITKGLYALPKGTTLDGLSPPISFIKGKDASNGCFYEMGINNAKFVELGGGKPFCVPKSLATS